MLLPSPRFRAFSLIELLVVIAVIALLLALLLPAMRAARDKASEVKSVSNLRELQAANIMYANDHDGSYVPVRFGLTSGWNNSGDGTATDSRWMKNIAFLQYLGVPEQTPESWASVAKSGKPVRIRRGTDVFTDGTYTVGWNNSDLIFSPNGLGTGSRWSLRVPEVRYPNKLIAFAECTDWMAGHTASGVYVIDKWTEAYDQGQTIPYPNMVGPAFRYNGRAAVVTFSGAVQLLTRAEAGDFSRWSIRAAGNQ